MLEFRLLFVLGIFVLSGHTQVLLADDVNKTVHWNHEPEKDKQVSAFVDSLLQQELTVDGAMRVALLNNPEIQATNATLNSFAIQETYYNLQAVHLKQELLASLVQATEAASQLAKEQRAQGNINDLELQQRLNSHLESQVELTRSQLEEIGLREKLNTLLGLSSSDSWFISRDLPPLPTGELTADRLKSIASQRPDLTDVSWETARDQLLINRRLVLMYQQELLPLQEEILSMAQRFYNTMSLGVYKLLDAKRDQLRMQIDYQMQLRDYWIARAQLDRALGGNLHLAVGTHVDEQNSKSIPQEPVANSALKQDSSHFVPFTVNNPPYTPVVTPNGSTLPWTLEEGVKVFRLTAEPIQHEFAPGITINCWGYNGQTPGPTIEAVEGDRVRILVTNKLPEPTTVHWHGILLPNGMDGVSGLNQPPIPPGETFKYEFTLRQSGTHMYHPHYDEMTQTAWGMMGFFIIHPKNPTEEERTDRDFAIMLHEWSVPIGGSTPNPRSMDFNYFTFNSKVWPGSESLVVKTGQKVRIRFGNLSMDSHPIHLHGYEFTVVAQGATRMKPSAQYQAVTTNVPVGDTREFEFLANAPGDWAFHCHKSHHTMNGMEHDIPNLMGVNQDASAAAIQKLLPQYRSQGTTGLGAMFDMHHPPKGPPNFLRMGSPGQFGSIELSGMFTVLKVRDGITSYNDPGWYQNPPGTVAGPVNLSLKEGKK